MNASSLTRGLFGLIVGLILVTGLTGHAGGAYAAASQVTETQSCVAGKANVTFNWQGNDTSATQQWIDLTLFDNGWQDGSYISAGPLSGRTTTYLWAGLNTRSQHYVRINQQLLSGAWDPSSTFVFTTIDCGVSTPATSGGQGAAYTLLGFSDHTSNGGPPPDIVAPGGILRSCNPRNLFAFLRIDNLPAPTDIDVAWFIGGMAIPRGTITVTSPGPLTLSWGFDQNTSAQTTYGLRLSTDVMGPPVLQGTFTLVC